MEVVGTCLVVKEYVQCVLAPGECEGELSETRIFRLDSLLCCLLALHTVILRFPVHYTLSSCFTASNNLWEAICKAEGGCRPLLLLHLLLLLLLKVALKGKCLLLLLLGVVAAVVAKLRVVVIS